MLETLVSVELCIEIAVFFGVGLSNGETLDDTAGETVTDDPVGLLSEALRFLELPEEGGLDAGRFIEDELFAVYVDSNDDCLLLEVLADFDFIFKGTNRELGKLICPGNSVKL